MIARTLPRLPTVNGRKLIDLDIAIADAINRDFLQMEAAQARRDAETAVASLLRHVTGQNFTVRLEEPS